MAILEKLTNILLFHFGQKYFLEYMNTCKNLGKRFKFVHAHSAQAEFQTHTKNFINPRDPL